MTAKELVAANIRFARKRLGLTQAEAGGRIGLSQQSWTKYESGELSVGLEVLEEIARALNTTMSALVSSSSPETALVDQISSHAANLPVADQQEILAIIELKEQRTPYTTAMPKPPEVVRKKAKPRRTGDD